MSAPPAHETMVPLPKHWTTIAKTGLLQVIGLARFAVLDVCAGYANGRSPDARVAARMTELTVEVAQLREELRIKDARMDRLEPRRRPHFTGQLRLAILELRAARGWTTAETARRFLITAATIASWSVRLDEDGEDALVRTLVPVNRLPEYLGEVIRSIRATFPMLGTKRIGQILARSSLHLSEMTVRRRVKDGSPANPPNGAGGGAPAPHAVAKTQVATAGKIPSLAHRVTAKYAHHVWHIDFTFVPARGGLWVPWFPFSLPQCWPFGWWVGAVLDHHSRTIATAHAWRGQPTAAATVDLLDDAIAAAGRSPKHIVSDRGPQFQSDYLDWCRLHGVRARFGAVHQHGSIAMIERFWRSMKDECFRRTRVPLGLVAMRVELAAYLRWYHEARPHQSLGGLTPAERLSGACPARDKRRLETRPLMPIARDGPMRTRPRRVKGPLELCVVCEIGAAKLPVLELRQAA